MVAGKSSSQFPAHCPSATAPSSVKRQLGQYHFFLFVLMVLTFYLWAHLKLATDYKIVRARHTGYYSSSPSIGTQLHKGGVATTVAPMHQAVDCKGLTIGSAYFERVEHTLIIHMTSGYRGWQSYTPFAPESIRCSYL
jgi:hypothetical protein